MNEHQENHEEAKQNQSISDESNTDNTIGKRNIGKQLCWLILTSIILQGIWVVIYFFAHALIESGSIDEALRVVGTITVFFHVPMFILYYLLILAVVYMPVMITLMTRKKGRKPSEQSVLIMIIYYCICLTGGVLFSMMFAPGLLGMLIGVVLIGAGTMWWIKRRGLLENEV